MSLRPESWAVIGTALVGITAAAMAFLKTPPDKRLRLRAPTLEERLAACPPEEGARIVRGDWRRALRRDLPWLVAFLPLAALAAWLNASEGDECAALLGVGRLRLAVIAFAGVGPLLMFAGGLQAVFQAIASWRSGYWPPLGWPQYRNTIARAGRFARVRAAVVLVLFTLSMAVLAFAYAQVAEAVDGKLWPALDAAEQACRAKG